MDKRIACWNQRIYLQILLLSLILMKGCNSKLEKWVSEKGIDHCVIYSQIEDYHQNCKVCEPGYFRSSDGLECRLCALSCKQCTKYTSCESCFKGFYKAFQEEFPFFRCQKCEENCTDCNSKEECTECEFGFKINSGKCMPLEKENDDDKEYFTELASGLWQLKILLPFILIAFFLSVFYFDFEPNQTNSPLSGKEIQAERRRSTSSSDNQCYIDENFGRFIEDIGQEDDDDDDEDDMISLEERGHEID